MNTSPWINKKSVTLPEHRILFSNPISRFLVDKPSVERHRQPWQMLSYKILFDQNLLQDGAKRCPAFLKINKNKVKIFLTGSLSESTLHSRRFLKWPWNVRNGTKKLNFWVRVSSLPYIKQEIESSMIVSWL